MPNPIPEIGRILNNAAMQEAQEQALHRMAITQAMIAVTAALAVKDYQDALDISGTSKTLMNNVHPELVAEAAEKYVTTMFERLAK